ncbi:MAG: ribose-5-phosphate isomerase RpiA [Planctomycetota bacterium]
MTDPNVAKRAAARAAADLVQDGMKLGLGSGSTFLLVLERLAERMRTENLKVTGVPTSAGTAAAAQERGIPLLSMVEVERLDLAIDGADEVDPQKNLIKGGGAAHVREKIVAAAAKELLVVVDETKLVEVLGRSFPLPVEVQQFGWKQTERAIAATGCKPALRRTASEEPVVTDNGNFIIDCKYDGIDDPAWLHSHLNSLPGVVDNGLFVGIAGRIVVGDAQGKTRIVP